VLLYTYVRPGEGRVLEWADVDFTTNKICVSKARDGCEPTRLEFSRELHDGAYRGGGSNPSASTHPLALTREREPLARWYGA
jgi:hypothetical protein